jgi:hypothetical protein
MRDMSAADAANGEPDAQEQKPSVERSLRGDEVRAVRRVLWHGGVGWPRAHWPV